MSTTETKNNIRAAFATIANNTKEEHTREFALRQFRALESVTPELQCAGCGGNLDNGACMSPECHSIVRAVNSHADMLEALDSLVKRLDGSYSNVPVSEIRKAKAIVAKARGGAAS